MSGTRAGGLKAKAHNLANDPDFYKKIGRKGGQNGHTGGFASNKALAAIAGRKGGEKSRRGPSSKPYGGRAKPIIVDDLQHECVICHKHFFAKHQAALTCSDECRKRRLVEQQQKYRADRRALTN